MKDTYLILEPYVFIFQNKHNVLLYNSINGDHIESINSIEISNICKRLSSSANLYKTLLKNYELKNLTVTTFIDNLRDKFMGDIYANDENLHKVVVMKPKCHNLKRIDKLGGNSDLIEELFGGEFLSYINEVTFYLNYNKNKHNLMKHDAYKQFVYPHNTNCKEELNIIYFKKVIEEIKNRSLSQINIVGDSVLKYSQLLPIIDELDGVELALTLYINYFDIFEETVVFRNVINLLESRKNKNKSFSYLFIIQVPFPIDDSRFEKSQQLLDGLDCIFQYNFIIESENEHKKLQELVMNNKISDYTIVPYFNKTNLEFFKQNVFITKNDIFESKPTEKEIFIQEAINTNNFGKIIIFNNGQVYSNPNTSRLGNIKKDSLKSMIKKEFLHRKSWFKTRQYLSSCKGCNYKYLCPSPSNYEFALKQNNLCNLN